MSHSTVHQAVEDEALLNRVTAAAQKEAQNNPELSATAFARQLRDNPAMAQRFQWPVGIDYEDAYASALAASNPDPGGDESVITDGNITSAVVAHWPPDAPPPV